VAAEACGSVEIIALFVLGFCQIAVAASAFCFQSGLSGLLH
jgi:hypothetical protein